MIVFPDLLLAGAALLLLLIALGGHRVPRLVRVSRVSREYGMMFAFIFIFQNGIARACVVPTGSMEPTIQVQDRVWVNVLGTRLQGVHRGEVVVLHSPEETKVLCKRVVAVGGDKLEVRQGKLWINDQAQNEKFLSEPIQGNYGPYRVPPRHIFVMGDNRNNSRDSRFFGSVLESDVMGRVSGIFWPFGRVSPL